MTREQEREIIDKILAGEADEFEKLVAYAQDKVYNLALRMTGSEEDAFDIAQEAFLKAYSSLESFRGDSGFISWLYRMTANLCIDFLRREKKRKTGSLTYIDEGMEQREMDIPDWRYSPEKQLERAEFRRSLESGLSRLEPEARQIILMREIAEMSYEEIGDALGLKEGTVKSKIHRARVRLCKILTDIGADSV